MRLRVRVLVLESSGVITARVLEGLRPELEVLPLAEPRALLADEVARLRPDLVLVELREITPDLVRAVETVMAETPARLLFFAATEALCTAAGTLRAAGAMDVLVLPRADDRAAFESLRHQVLATARVPVVNHPRGKRRRTSVRFGTVRLEAPVVAIAASLGGPKALEVLLKAVPKGFPAPIVLCQHITPGFSDDLARWLAAETGHAVHEAVEGQQLVKGEVFVAPANVHMRVHQTGRVRLDDTPPVGGFRPSCDVLLGSVAQAFEGRAIGVVLTGMGADGARGLLEIRRHGGHTVAQDQASCVVFGMPKEAIALGGAEKVLPLVEIASQLERWVR